jgi:predicted Rossmann fold flavoprotein
MPRMTQAEGGVWDVAVIGGGPAGMMAAGRAAELGARVVLVEKNATLGKKLLITGGGRCNVTNAEPDLKKLLARFKRGGKFLPSPFSQFDNQSALRFFNERGMPTKVEAEQRAFPASDDAHSVWDVLVAYMNAGGVTVLSNSPVVKVNAKDGHIESVVLKNKKEVCAKRFIFATGGLSHPETGSTGDGFAWLRELGHTVSDTNAALVPIALHDTWVKRAAGVALSDVKIAAYQNDAKQEERRGKVLFTHVGLSGPAILNMSRDIGELLKYGEVVLELDLLASEGPEKVNARLQELLREDASNKMIKNVLGALIPPALVSPLLELAQIPGETVCNSVTRVQRLALAHLLKHLRVRVKSLLGLEKAIITSGGVAREELDWKTMRSLKYDNLYIVGDLLDIDRPSGGYSLQLCWTTGFVAGSSIEVIL